MLRRRFLALALALLTLAGCASTRIVNQWETSTPGPAFKLLLVVGVTRNASVRRTFEDEFVKALQARGVKAVQSYLFIPEDGPISEARLAGAVKEAGADGVITSRVIQVQQQVDVVPTGPAFWGPPWGFYGWYGGAWGPVYAYPPQVVTRDVVYAEVRLFRTQPDSLVWAATTSTFAPGNPASESAAFARVIIDQLVQRGLIG